MAIAAKDLRLLARDRLDLFFTLVFPLIFALFFGFIYANAGSGALQLNVAVVNEDGGPASLDLARDLGLSEGLIVQAAPDRATGLELVRKGKSAAVIIIPPDFTASFDEIFTGGAIKLEAYVDPARKTEAGLLTGKLNELAFRQFGNVFQTPGRAREMLNRARGTLDGRADIPPLTRTLLSGVFLSADKLLEEQARTATPETPAARTEGRAPGFAPVQVKVSEVTPERDGPTNAYAVSFPQGVVWALMGCVTSFASGLVLERSRGTLLRLTAAPLGLPTVLLGKSLATFLACMAVQALLLAVFVMPMLGVKVQSPLALLAAMGCAAAAFTGIMMVVATLGRSEGGSAGAGRAFILILAMIGGGTIPVAFMPPALRAVSGVSPFTWAVRGIEGALWRGYSWGEMATPCAVLLGFGAVGFGLGTLMFLRQVRR